VGLRRRRSGRSGRERRRRPSQELNGALSAPRGAEEAAPKADTRSPGNPGHFLLQRFGLIILLLALVFSVSNALTLSGDARIVLLKGDGSSPFLHGEQSYRQAADELLASSVWNRSKITVNTGGISRGMLKRFPELSDVSVTLPLVSKRPTVYVQTAQEALILKAPDGSFVVGTDGKKLLEADNLPSADRHKLPVVTDNSGLGARFRQQVLSSSDVSFIRTVSAELAARHVGVTSMDLPAGKRELDVHVSGEPYLVKFNLESGTARSQAGTYLATRAELKRRHTTPSQYIDVRVDGRSYYK
jgi:hypothetical protein